MRGSKAIATLVSLAALTAPAAASAANNGTGGTAPPPKGDSHSRGDSSTGGAQYAPPSSTQPTGEPGVATLVNGVAHAPAGAPKAVVRAIKAGNRIQNKPYLYGGGHRQFEDSAYDCSGAVSYALHGGGLLRSPLDSGSMMKWGLAGRGSWITVYANAGHAYMTIAGLRLDTSGTGGRGPRWLTEQRDSAGFTARHPAGL
jgi:cell wall-associated NlpC family hydrolase